MKIIKSIIREILGFILFQISFIVPKNKNIWLFGSRFGFNYADNSKYLFEYASQNKDLKCIWISKSKNVVNKVRELGYVAYHEKSLLGILNSLRAKIIISSYNPYQDVLGYTIRRALIIQLFHGTPLKKINLDDVYATKELKINKFKKFLLKLFPYKNPNNLDILISSSEFIIPYLESAFGINKRKIKVTGLPRNDALFQLKTSSFVENIKKEFNNPVIIAYMPTYQQDKNKNLKIHLDEFWQNLTNINNFLELNNCVLILRLHPVVWDKLENNNEKEIKFTNINNNIILIGDKLSRIIKGNGEGLDDFYPILKDVDILITDYSSVYFDFLLLNRPIIFAKFDKGNMLERGFYFDYDEVTPGPKVTCWDDVLEKIKMFLANPKLYEEERLQIQKKFNKYIDGNSSERVYNEIMKIL